MSNPSENDQELMCLFEFPDEKNSIAVGNSSWIRIEEENVVVDQEWLQKAMTEGREVEVRWPQTEILPPLKMKKHLSKKKVEWTKCAAIVRSHGNWVDMCDKRKTLEKFGTADSKRSDRKLAASKHKRSSTEIASNKDGLRDAKLTKPSKELKKNLVKEKKKQQLEDISSAKQLHSAAQDLGSESDSDGEDDYNVYKNLGKSDLIDKIRILELELTASKSKIESIQSKLKDAESVSGSTLLKNATDASEKMKSVNKELDYARKQAKKMIADFDAYRREIKNHEITEEFSSSANSWNKGQEKPMTYDGTTSKHDGTTSTYDETTSTSKETNLSTSTYIDSNKKSDESDKMSINSDKTSVVASMDTKPTNYDCSRCNHRKPEILINNAIDKVFTIEELQSCTLSGKGNASKTFDASKIELIEDYVVKNKHRFPHPRTNDELIALVKSTLANKASNEKKKLKKLQNT